MNKPMNDEPDAVPPPDSPKVEPTVIPLRWVRISHHTPDHVAARYPYAAYGSNLSLAQMARRCPDANIHGNGVLRNAKLVFAYYLGIMEADGASVPVAVYNMTAANVAAMDRCEGLGRSYERYLVTVEINGEAMRCFTYVKRDNALEEPSDRYYQTCLAGYADFNFDARRLRHAREDARKNGKRRTYSTTYGHWNGTQTTSDWDAYRKGSTANRNTMVPTVRTYDPTIDGGDIPEAASGTAASYQPRTSLVTGRQLTGNRAQRRADAAKMIQAQAARFEALDPSRISTLNGSGQEGFVNPRNSERWRKGSNGIWYRVKE